MSMPIRIIDTGLQSAGLNAAMCAALLELHHAGRIPDTWRFYRQPSAVLLGLDKSYRGEIRAEHCRLNKIEIARRCTVGDTVYVGPGILSWEIIIGSDSFGPWIGNLGVFVGRALSAGVSRLGLPTQYKPPCDIVINGRKLARSFATSVGNTFVIFGDINIEADFSEGTKTLRRGNHAPEYSVNLSEFIGRVPALEDVEGVLIAELSNRLRWTPVSGSVTNEEAALAERLLADKFGKQEFILGHSRKRNIASAIRPREYRT